MISHEKTKRHNNSSAFLTMIVKRVTGTHSSIIMAINKLYDHGAGRPFAAASDFALVSQSVGRSVRIKFFYKCSKYIVYTRTRLGSGVVVHIQQPREKRRRRRVFF